MKNVKALLRNKLFIALTIGLTAGVLLGLVYGYVINPVEWVDAPMEVTRRDVQEDYLRMAIDSYQAHGNDLMAITRWQELGIDANEVLNAIKYSPGDQGWEAILDYEKAVTIQDARPVEVACETLPVTDNRFYIYLWAGTTLLVIGLAVFFYIQAQPQTIGQGSKPIPVFKIRESVKPPPAKRPRQDQAEQLLVSEKERYRKNPPLANHIWSFVMGDDEYEETYSINSNRGHFLGECGIAIAKTMDKSSPRRATAFDIWLFDKNEINTRSIILMSHNAYENDLLRTQFELKGEPILAEIGKEIEVKTDHMRMWIRVLDMVCAENTLGRCEYFQRLSLDVNIWHT